MVNRREIVKRGISLVFALPLVTKLQTEKTAANSLLIEDCIIRNGNPLWNPDNLIEEYKKGYAIRKKEFYVMNRLSLGNSPTRLRINRCTFIDVELHLNRGTYNSSITNSTFTKGLHVEYRD